MRISTIIVCSVALAAAAPALAQSTRAKNNSAIKDSHTVNDGRSRSGANSFTEAQAREHIAKSGFSDVSALTKDKKGVWRGIATKDGHRLHVGLDFKGNVSTGK